MERDQKSYTTQDLMKLLASEVKKHRSAMELKRERFLDSLDECDDAEEFDELTAPVTEAELNGTDWIKKGLF